MIHLILNEPAGPAACNAAARAAPSGSLNAGWFPEVPDRFPNLSVAAGLAIDSSDYICNLKFVLHL
jgi:hypothetical protein